MNTKICGDLKERYQKKCRIGLWLSQLEKDQFKNLSAKEHFTSLSQYIRSRCLHETITNSELADKLMITFAQKFLEESQKYYPSLKDKVYSEDMLIKPGNSSSSFNSKSISSENNDKKKKIVRRTRYISFLITKEEKVQLKLKSSNSGFKTMSKYIRNRCLKEQITKYQLISILSSFITYKLLEFSVSPDKKLQWKKQKAKNQFNLTPLLLGFSNEKKEKFESSIKELTDMYSKEIQEELSSILLTQKLKLEQACVC